jgi:hypothetical protein
LVGEHLLHLHRLLALLGQTVLVLRLELF